MGGGGRVTGEKAVSRYGFKVRGGGGIERGRICWFNGLVFVFPLHTAAVVDFLRTRRMLGELCMHRDGRITGAIRGGERGSTWWRSSTTQTPPADSLAIPNGGVRTRRAWEVGPSHQQRRQRARNGGGSSTPRKTYERRQHRSFRVFYAVCPSKPRPKALTRS